MRVLACRSSSCTTLTSSPLALSKIEKVRRNVCQVIVLGNTRTHASRTDRALQDHARRVRLFALFIQLANTQPSACVYGVGFLVMIQEHLVLPFPVTILGTDAIVEKIDMARNGRIVAICRCGNVRQKIGILDLPLPTPHRQARSGSLPIIIGARGSR